MSKLSKDSYNDFEKYCENFVFPQFDSMKDRQKLIEVHQYVYNYHYIIRALNYDDEFLKESSSDFLTTMFLLRTNLTKASLVCLRGSVENFMRFMCNKYSESPETIYSTNVLNLFEVNKTFFSAYPFVVEKIGQLYSLYSDLCSYSHSALEEHQSLYKSLKSMKEIDSQLLAKATGLIERAYKLFAYILYTLFYKIDKKYRMNIEHTLREEFVNLIPSEVRTEIKII